jgi:CRISPR-associated exonuclease Cas4
MEQSDPIPLSYLSQYYYCPRRAALLLLEQAWEENEYTASGRAEHNRVHTARFEKRGSLVKLYEYSVFSKFLSLSGKCDCIEATENGEGCVLPFSEAKYSLYPIEYKHGKVRSELEYQIQLCAQGICLEEMYSCHIEKGAIFYIDAHRRDEICLTESLRNYVTSGAEALAEMIKTKQIPTAQYSSKCGKCSLANYCLPKVKPSAKNYCSRLCSIACDKGEE